MQIQYINALWQQFAHVPVDEHDKTEVDFYHWPAGTEKFAIWDWFDEKHPVGVNALLYQ